MLILILSVLSVGLSVSEGARFPGQCNTAIPAEANFNLTRFSGRWRLISSYANPRQTGTCNEANYEIINSNTYSLVNSHVVNQNLVSVSGTAVLASTDRSARFTVSIGTNPQVSYWILGTDYDEYALAYSCQNLANNEQEVYSWKLSRTATLSVQANNNMNTIINSIDVLNNNLFVNADQSDTACFHYPAFQLNEPVIFPGQCDPNINVVSNLNLTAFQGEWVLIQTYYSERQSGTCNRAEYALNGNVLSVVNSHVVNQNRLSVSGTATSATGDGKLVVNIGTNPPVNYWILGTNYDSYALAYSCQNIDSERRRVWSWKLSRTTYLRNEDAQAINNLMTNVNVLDDRYFQNADQSDAACFYYPDITLREPVIFPGQCDPNINVVRNFNMTGFQGEWVLIQTYYSERQSGTCNRAEYTLNGNVYNLVNSHVVNQNRLSVSGTAVSIAGDGKLIVNIGSNPAVNYWILGTNYETYALAYSCQNLENNRRRVWSWKLSRTTSLRNEDNQAINSLMSNVDVLDQRYFQNADQTDAACFYYPDITLREPVIFPGQCDPNINVVNNFNLTQFQGEWVLIQTYYSERQSGTCNRAAYTLNGNVLNLVNSHVVNQNLLSVSGTATSPTGDGKLVVNIGSNPVVNYWILGTNYETYALAYSCQNLENNRRRVWSWKLSRTTTLRNEDNQAINNLMSNVNVLDQRYFQNADQSNAACFYLPDIPLGEPVIFRGQCELNVPVVSNFNVTAFLGDWHLMATYFDHRQSGTCNVASYTMSGNVIQLVNKHVVNGTQLSVSGTAVASADGSGKLTVTISNRNTDYWILGTDYYDYALAYSCSNLENNYRRVYSWKLSRTKSLSVQANNAMNTIINNVNVLNERYFESTNQTNAGCFHLPEFADGQRIILPGQCDPNIPVVANFNANEYSGTWYQIQRYPQVFENGDCTGARYTLNGDVVTVLNWQRLNGVLDSIEGNATIISTDGSAKLRVVLPSRGPNAIPGQTSSYDLYVLDTDYESYSLAYSCVNTDAHHRAIGAWKLSRRRTMSPAGNNAIDCYMANRMELENRYFIDVEQNDSCPEPSSAMLYKSSITVLFVLFLALLNMS